MRNLVAAIRQVERMLQRADAADAANRTPATRSIAAARDLAGGTVVQWQDLTWLRPGSGLRPGSEERVVGRRLRTAVAAGQLLLPEHLG
jgi:sialic acid synthase SpsE